MKFLAVLAVLAMAFAIVAIVPSDSSDAADPEKAIVEIKGDIVGTDEALTFDADQKVILIGNANVGTETQPAHMVVKGELEIPAGYKLTVVGNSKLEIMGGAQAIIDGTLVVDDYLDNRYDKNNQGLIVEGGNVIISGSATINGYMNMKEGGDPAKTGIVTVKEGGEFTIGALGEMDVDVNGKLIIEKNATATIKGICAADSIENSGTVVLKTEEGISDDVKIAMMADGAVVDVQRIILANTDATTGAHKLIITDEGQVLYSKRTDVVKVGDSNTYPVNKITVSSEVAANFQDVVSGLYVKERVSSAPGEDGDVGYVTFNERTYTWNMELDGKVTAKQETVNPDSEDPTSSPKIKIEVSALRGAAVADGAKLDIGANITLDNVANSQLTVAGDLVANHGSESASSMSTVSNSGIIIMSGTGIMEVLKKITITAPAEIRGAMIDYSDYLQYMKIDLAISKANVDADISDITVVGNDDVSKSATVRADLTIKANSDFTIGENDNTVVLTMAEDSSIRGTGIVTVGGTLFAENKTNVRSTVISDVYSEEVDEKGKAVREGWAKWTNLQTALTEATEGTKITVSSTGYIILKSNTEVKKGVTLYVPEDCRGIVLRNGVTLTINGIYDNESSIYAEANFDTVAKNVKDDRTSAIVVNGKMINSVDVYGYNIVDARKDQTISNFEEAIRDGKCPELETGAPIAGAYYTADEDFVVSKLESALMNVEDITGEIKVKGSVSVGDVIFMGTENCDEIFVFEGVADMPTVLEVGNILLSGSKITIATDGALFGELTGTITDGVNSVKVKGLSSATATGEVVIAELDDEFSIAGGFYLNDENDSFSVSAGTVKTKTGVVFSGAHSGATVASGATLEAAGDSATFKTLTVNGTLYVPNGKAINAEDVKVSGSIIVAEPTASKGAGNMTSRNLYVGISSFNTKETSSDAAIIGPISTPTVKAVVLNGSTIDASAQAAIDELSKVTEFYVKDALWITVYDASANDPIRDATGKYYYVPKNLENCDFLAWQNDNEKSVASGTFVGDEDKIYAEIDYDIYTVTVVTDSGIKAVSVDGIQMLRAPSPTGGTNTFTTLHPIEAGSHKVTYTLQDGYQGTATLYTEYGTILQNLSFTVSGTDPDQRDVTFQLYGTEKEVPAEPEEESEWTVTTILLLILVILIAVMAIIVAMRLNRS